MKISAKHVPTSIHEWGPDYGYEPQVNYYETAHYKLYVYYFHQQQTAEFAMFWRAKLIRFMQQGQRGLTLDFPNELLIYAAKNGHNAAIEQVLCFYQILLTMHDELSMLDVLDKATNIQLENPERLFQIAQSYQVGIFTPRGLFTAMNLYEHLADKYQHKGACLELGHIYWYGIDDIEPDRARAIDYYQRGELTGTLVWKLYAKVTGFFQISNKDNYPNYDDETPLNSQSPSPSYTPSSSPPTPAIT